MNYFKWFIPPAPMTEEQTKVIPTEIAVRTPFALLRVLETISNRSLKNIIGVESLPQNIKSKQFTDELGSLFDKYGTDKRVNGYDPIYGYIFSVLVPNPTILEIGLGSNDPNIYCNMGINYPVGASLKAFKEFSTKSIVDGADIDKNIAIDGHRIFYVDQTRPETFSNIVENGELEYDLIIDDGMHAPDSQLHTLEFALRHISNNGYILIEDIHEHNLVIWKIVRHFLSESNYYCNLIQTFPEYMKGRAAYVFVCTANENGKQLFKV
mgnify:CR=1 FL=1